MMWLYQLTNGFTYYTFCMGVSHSCRVSGEEYGADDDDKILIDDGGYWNGLVIRLLPQNVGSAGGAHEARLCSLDLRRIISTCFLRAVEDLRKPRAELRSPQEESKCNTRCGSTLTDSRWTGRRTGKCEGCQPWRDVVGRIVE